VQRLDANAARDAGEHVRIEHVHMGLALENGEQDRRPIGVEARSHAPRRSVDRGRKERLDLDEQGLRFSSETRGLGVGDRREGSRSVSRSRRSAR